MLMFSKTLIQSFVYDLIDVFMFPDKELFVSTILLARYKRASRSDIPAYATLARRYRGRVAAGRRKKPPRIGQRGSGFFYT